MNNNFPFDWKVAPLATEVIKYQNGYAFPSEGYSSEGVPIVTIANVSLDGLFQFNPIKEKKWPADKSTSLENFFVNSGDVIIAMTDVTPNMAVIGRGAFVSRNYRMLLNQRVGLIKPTDNLLPQYLSYVLNSDYWRAYCKRVAALGAQANIGTKEILDGVIAIPTIGEQIKITEILAAIDEQIEVTGKLIEKKSSIAEGILHNFLINNHSKSWSNKTLRDIFTICYGKDHKNINDGPYPVLGTGGVMRHCSSYLYDNPSVLIGRKGSIDKTQFIEEPFWTVDTLFYTKIHEGYDPYFVYLLTKIIDFRSLNEATGVPSLNTESIYRVSVTVPDNIGEQEKIVEIMRCVYSDLTNEENYLNKLRKKKQGLMQDLLTGRVRVN